MVIKTTSYSAILIGKKEYLLHSEGERENFPIRVRNNESEMRLASKRRALINIVSIQSIS